MSNQVAADGQTDLAAQITAALVGLAKPAAAAPTVPAASPPAAAQQTAADAVAEATTRIFAILDCDEAKDKPKLARTLAANGKLSVDEAKALLAAASPEAAAPAADDKSRLAAGFEAHMAKRGNSAGVKPDAAAEGNPQRPSLAQRVSTRYPSKKGA